MTPITKKEYEIMLETGILKQYHGNINGLMIVGKHHPASQKQRYVEEPIYERYLKSIKVEK